MEPARTGLTRRIALGALAGGATTAAFPPLDQRWVALICLVPLLLALRGARRREAVLAGVAFGLVFFGVLIYWISYFGYAAYVTLLATETFFIAVFAFFGARLTRSAWGRLAGVPLVWTALEIARSRVPVGGFSWGDLGYSQHGGGPLLHLAPVGGVFGITLAIVAINALLAEILAGGPARTRAAQLLAAGALVVVPALIPTGLAGARTADLDVAAVQGNVPRDRFTGLARRGRVGPEDPVIVANHLRLTATLDPSNRPDLIVWPENSFDRDPRTNPHLFEPVAAEIRRIGAPLLAGAVEDAGERWTNSMIVVSPQTGRIEEQYDKIHLVPFGEYVPIKLFRSIVPALDRELPVDAIAGSASTALQIDGARVGPLICFESTYPELARAQVRHGAQILVVGTNNASFGTSPAAREHLAMSQMRAVETGRAVVHAAISGVSALIEPDGTIVARAGLYRPALLRARLPLAQGKTVYVAFGGMIELVICLLALAAVVRIRLAVSAA